MYSFQAHLKDDLFERLAKRLKYKKAFLENALITFFLDDEKRKSFFNLHPAEEKELLELIKNPNAVISNPAKIQNVEEKKKETKKVKSVQVQAVTQTDNANTDNDAYEL